MFLFSHRSNARMRAPINTPYPIYYFKLGNCRLISFSLLSLHFTDLLLLWPCFYFTVMKYASRSNVLHHLLLLHENSHTKNTNSNLNKNEMNLQRFSFFPCYVVLVALGSVTMVFHLQLTLTTHTHTKPN